MVEASTDLVDTLLLTPTDTAFVINPAPAPNANETNTSKAISELNILFSNKKWPSLKVQALTVKNMRMLTDLNADNQPTLILSLAGKDRCWGNVSVFGMKNSTWRLLEKGSLYFCKDKYPLDKRIEKMDDSLFLLTDSLSADKMIINKKEIKF